MILAALVNKVMIVEDAMLMLLYTAFGNIVFPLDSNFSTIRRTV